MLYIGIDLGGTAIKAGVVDENGAILSKVSCPTGVERGPEAVIRDMASLAQQAADAAGKTMDDIASIGIGIPGIHDNERNIVPMCTNLFWHQVPLIPIMHKYVDKPIFVDNDATIAGLAEAVAGVSSGVKNSVFVTLGTGVGGGIVINGKVYTGPHGVASEIGHMIIKFDGEPCTCGNLGCWERYASATALIRMGREAASMHPESAIAKNANGDLEKLTAKDVMECAKAGDPAAKKVFDDYITYLCVGFVNLINLYDPEIIALGGGVSAAGDFLLEAIREKLPSMVFYKTMPYARIELATLGNDAGIIGAAMLGK
ncbi:MAG: ROK family protein [Christensenellales bacterium]|jgi:glucokinase